MNIVSFDIFDTCLLRLCGTANSLIDILSRRAFSQPVSDAEFHTFLRARLDADLFLDKSDKTIVDIYANIHYNHPYLLPMEEIRKIELDLEREMLVPAYNMRELVSEFRNKGYRILFISDMYLPSVFLMEVLTNTGFFKEGDHLYVSCEHGCTKSEGSLFRYIAENEHISYHYWHHYGDNKISDVSVPKSLGIKATLVNNQYLTYPKNWLINDVSTHDRIGMLVAGLSRGVYYQIPNSYHKNIVVDVIAPLYVSFVCRILNDAVKRGINKLFFCARDASSLYRIAKRIVSNYSNLEVAYLYISQQSLYQGDCDTMIGYFLQEGLATHNSSVAIVDIRSTGKTLKVLNSLLKEKGFRQVYGYFFEMFCNGRPMDDLPPYYCEIDHVYSKMYGGTLFKGIQHHWCLFEMFFSLHNERRTINYEHRDGSYYPVFAEKNDGVECKMKNLSSVSAIHNMVFECYADGFANMGLIAVADYVFNGIALPTLVDFFNNPNPNYLEALTDFYVRDEYSLKLRPYVEKHSLVYLFFKKNTLMWRRASINYSLSPFVRRILGF